MRSLASALNGEISKTLDESCEMWRSCLASYLLFFTITVVSIFKKCRLLSSCLPSLTTPKVKLFQNISENSTEALPGVLSCMSIFGVLVNMKEMQSFFLNKQINMVLLVEFWCVLVFNIFQYITVSNIL